MSFTKGRIFLIAVLIITFAIGFWVGKARVVCEICPPDDIDFSLFWETWNKLNEMYISQEDIDVQKMIYGATAGMVESLEDPHTVFFTPEEAKTFLEDVSGRFEGVGMEIGIRNEQLQIIAPLEGTPAQKAGLRSGDKIIKIDDTSTRDISIEEAVSLIRGPKGTEVILTILRKEWDTTEEFKVTRAVINIPSLKWELKDDNIVYIRLYNFSGKLRDDFAKAASEILKSPADKVILDLRNNPGGYLQRAQDIAGWFLEKGNVVVIEDFGGKREPEVYQTVGNSKFLDYPMVILINQGTASAAEILAAALRDNRDIQLIGETSFGKGSVQELEDLRGGSSVKITVAHWLTPNGALINDIGLEPNIIVEMTEEDYQEDRDPQLNRAIEIVNELR